jgi:Ca2+:H+ antiporter
MIFTILLLFIPISLVLEYIVHAPPIWVFITSISGIVPLAEWMRRGTEHTAHHAGEAIGGLLNVTFGNMAELILAIFVLMAGNTEVVKAQITGSIIGNSLLGLGLAIVVGSFRRERLTFKRQRAGLLSSMLILAVIALLIPALFDLAERGTASAHMTEALDEKMSLGVSVVMILLYIANLIYSLVTHRDVFAVADGDDTDHDGHTHDAPWPLWKALSVLLGATVLTAIEAEMVSGALESTATDLGLSTFFLGIIVLAVVGNAAEYVSAVYFARRNRMTLVMSITVGATIQVALLIAPLLVVISYLIGHPMNLVFSNPLELIAIAGVAFAVNAIANDGETTWFEGVLLLGVYVLLGIAFYFVTPPGG